MKSHFTKPAKPKPSKVYDVYWRFAAERLSIFYRRINKVQPPWTNDDILRVYKFTNAFRAADRVSQYLIKEVIYAKDQTPSEVLFRILLFKFFNRIDTWRAIELQNGEVRWDDYEFSNYNRAMKVVKKLNGKIYSAAYIMASGKSAFGFDSKHANHLRLIESMMKSGLVDAVMNARSMSEVFEILLTYPAIGDFLAYQLATDINYSTLTNFSEMTFVKAGPGAKDGIRKCFLSYGDYTEEDIIKLMADRQEEEFGRLGLQFPGLWGRSLQLIDCQNLFCEVDKYLRVAHPEVKGSSNRTRIKQKFKPNTVVNISYFFPPKWGLVTDKLPKNYNYG